MAARVLVPLALLSLPACVTQNIQFEPPRNYPPAIEPSASSTPIIRLDQLAGTADGGTGTEIVLDVTVRDPNVNDTLFFRVFRDYDPAIDPFAGPIQERQVPADDDRDGERALRVTLGRDFFGVERGCHRLELFVSQRFQSVPAREPAIAGDLGTQAWFVVADGDVTIEECRPWFSQ